MHSSTIIFLLIVLLASSILAVYPIPVKAAKGRSKLKVSGSHPYQPGIKLHMISGNTTPPPGNRKTPPPRYENTKKPPVSGWNPHQSVELHKTSQKTTSLPIDRNRNSNKAPITLSLFDRMCHPIPGKVPPTNKTNIAKMIYGLGFNTDIAGRRKWFYFMLINPNRCTARGFCKITQVINLRGITRNCAAPSAYYSKLREINRLRRLKEASKKQQESEE
ncbi:hypothetical protein BDP27DRAFT_1368645 [Rhodocollybia butyracea]|uniref:Uncharacterized protein n=1 Tax=Rhodocollybia butyracea TaxID=206335 RepID=A0A9P5U199_9AGAR|nr:hypothetical protein BDP27DRAFT_1368645 [Rhodocollybia butyracea]